MKNLMPIFTAILATLLAIIPSAHAAEQACAGNDMLQQLKAERPEAYDDVMRKASNQANSDAVLWRIDGAQTGKPSWLLGTIHLSDPRVTTLTQATRDAIAQSHTVALEIADVENKTALTQKAMSDPSIIMLPSGTSLWDHIDPAMKDETISRLKAVGLPAQAVAQMQPWLPATMLSFSPCQIRRAQSGHVGLDETVAKHARSAGKKIIGLETVHEQLSIMSSMSLNAQAAFLSSSVKMYSHIDDYMETMIQSYLNRQLSSLIPLVEAYFPDQSASETARVTDEFIDIMIERRNQTMAKRAKQHLDSGGLLIAVGALHLPGDQGLVALIRKQGFDVMAVE